MTPRRRQLMLATAVLGATLAGCAGERGSSQPAGTGQATAQSSTGSVEGGGSTTGAVDPPDAQAYLRHCANCHGPAGEGGSGPALAGNQMSREEMIAAVTAGVPPRMPAFGATLEPAEIQAIVRYVTSDLG